MIPLLKKLIRRRKEEITILLLDKENPHRQDSYLLQPDKMFLMLGGINIAIVLMVLMILFITPMGTFMFNKEHRSLRSSVLEIRQQVTVLQDSLEVRDKQLSEIQRVFRDNADTNFTVTSMEEWGKMYGEEQKQPGVMTYRLFENHAGIQALHSEQILNSGLFAGSFEFPVDAPVRGSVTGSYNPDKGHYGMDIATRKGADVRTVADGVIISCDWTLNNGYVMHILHTNSIITIYKHFSEVFHKTGDTVRQGDIIGKAGESGLLATGPHLHFEIWKNGISLDPALYLNLH